MHVELTLPSGIEVGPLQREKSGVRAVTTDGGHVVRNQRWSSPLRAYEASLPRRESSHADFVKVRAIWRKTREGAHSFNLTDWIESNTVRVRFVGELDISTPKRLPQHHIDTFTLEEVRDISPTNTVVPTITGTVQVGQTLTVGTGTWTGAPVSYARQWLRDGVEIAGATASTYVLVSADQGKKMSCDVIATDVDGGETLVTTAETVPVAP